MIRFGTSGWRAVISDQFTFANVRRVVRAVVATLAEQGVAAPRLAVGCDTRFLSEQFAAEAARTVVAAGGEAHLSAAPLPTPVLAFAIQSMKLDGGLNVTASHNPPEYNGLKFSNSHGAPAPPETTRRIEELAATADDGPAPATARPSALEPRDAYFARLSKLVDREALGSRRLRVAVDSRFGTSRGWLDMFLEEAGAEVIRVHDRRDPLFGGGTPDCSGANLDDLRRVVRSEGLDLGLATDGDGDRFGVVDSDGVEMAPNMVLGLLADDLLATRRWPGGIGRTVATTHLLDRVAARHGREIHETPVGFKYFGPLLEQGLIFMGAEESAGFSVAGHVPEKDGILAGLLVAELVARRGPGLGDHLHELFGQVGAVHARRRDLRFQDADRAALEARLTSPPSRLAGVPVERVESMDGAKWIRSDGAWLLVRLSGTEPVVRLYAEAGDEATVARLLTAGESLLP